MYVYGNLINFQWHPSILYNIYIYIFQTVVLHLQTIPEFALPMVFH